MDGLIANAFRNSRQYEMAAKAYEEAANCHVAVNSLFLAAKALETAGNLLSQQASKPQEAVVMFQKASDYFVAQGSGDRGGEMLEKAARAVESNVDQALELYCTSCDVFEQEDKLKFGVDVYKKAIAFAVRSNRMEKAILLSDRLEKAFIKIGNIPYAQRQALTNVVILLGTMKHNEAQTKFEASSQLSNGFTQSADGRAASDLLTAFQTGDKELYAETIKSNAIRFLDNDVAKLAKSIQIHDKPAIQAVENVESSQQVKKLQDEIEEEGFL